MFDGLLETNLSEGTGELIGLNFLEVSLICLFISHCYEGELCNVALGKNPIWEFDFENIGDLLGTED